MQKFPFGGQTLNIDFQSIYFLIFRRRRDRPQADRRSDVCFANVTFSLFLSSFYNDFCQVVIS